MRLRLRSFCNSEILFSFLTCLSLSACGKSNAEDSTTAAVTNPENHEIGRLRSYWIYEDRQDIRLPIEASILANEVGLPQTLEKDSLFLFSPEGISQFGQQILWTTGAGISASQISDPDFTHPGAYQRTNFSINKNSGVGIQFFFPHNLLDPLFDTNFKIGFKSKFEIKSTQNSEQKMVFEMKQTLVCFQLQNPLNIYETKQFVKNDVVSLNAGHSAVLLNQVITIETKDIIEFWKNCQTYPDYSVAEALEININGASQAELAFTGVQVSEERRD